MMRALWTAATGMTGQQTQVDVISNNLSNVNTVAISEASLPVSLTVRVSGKSTEALSSTNTTALANGL